MHPGLDHFIAVLDSQVGDVEWGSSSHALELMNILERELRQKVDASVDFYRADTDHALCYAALKAGLFLCTSRRGPVVSLTSEFLSGKELAGAVAAVETAGLIWVPWEILNLNSSPYQGVAWYEYLFGYE